MSSENADQKQLTDQTENKPRFITCFIHYSENDNQEQIFEVLKRFRKEKGLKFSHHRGYIFFTLLSTHLDELSRVRPFKISRFQTKSVYNCSKEVADKLMSQKDSFIRMNWDEEANTLTFLSRTVSRVHGQLIRRIFRDSQEEFIRTEYTILKDENTTPVNEEPSPVDDGFVKIPIKKFTKTSKPVKPVVDNKDKTNTTRDKTKYNKNKTPISDKGSDKPLIRGKK